MTSRSELDAFFNHLPAPDGVGRQRLGVVVGGSLSEGISVKLDPGQVPGGVIEDMAVGRYVVVEGQSGKKFFSIVTDILLDAINPDLAKNPPDPDDAFMKHVYGSELAFGALQIAPMLLLESANATPKPVKTIPAHFSDVFLAEEEDVNQVFGKEDAKHWHIGSPLDLEGVKVNLNLERFVERSSGVFGKSGTGKSFITRTILAGIVKAGTATNLIFDMHNDYGWAVLDEHGREYKGLRQLFDDGRVQVITLDPETSRHRNSKVDGTLQIGLDDIDPEDVEMLAGIIGLSEVQVGALYYLRRKLGRESNLGQQEKHLFSFSNNALGQFKINQGFTGSGHAVEQEGLGHASQARGVDGVDRGHRASGRHRRYVQHRAVQREADGHP